VAIILEIKKMMNYVIGFNVGILFAVIVLFAFKESTVIYKEGYDQCIIEHSKRNNTQLL